MNKLKLLALFLTILTTFVALGGCARKSDSLNAQSGVAATPTASSEQALPLVNTSTSGFDINQVPVVNPPLGAFPYFSLIDGYRRPAKTMAEDYNKEVAFDRYEFFDGTKIIPVEGRLTTIDAKGEGASAVQIMRTYESLVTGLGGVKVFEGTSENLKDLELKFADARHRSAWDDQFGVYVIHLPDREVWVEAFISGYPTQKGHYYLTVVERKALEIKAALLPAEQMKRELDSKGHVALYINFDFNKADIKAESQPIVDEVAKLLKTNPNLSLAVEGHTDNIGTPDYNRQLSEARARSVVAALTTKGIEGARLKSAGYGQDKPIADNGAEDGRAKNRRVELVKMSG
jgi:outer membrane protein OmpA-like peptidoglycan-associated protein